MSSVSNKIKRTIGNNIKKEMLFILGKGKIEIKEIPNIEINFLLLNKNESVKNIIKDKYKETIIDLKKKNDFKDKFTIILISNDINKDLCSKIAKVVKESNINGVIFLGHPSNETLLNFFFFVSVPCYGVINNNKLEKLNIVITEEAPKTLEEEVKKNKISLETIQEMFKTILELDLNNLPNDHLSKMIKTLHSSGQTKVFKNFISIIDCFTLEEKNLFSKNKKIELTEKRKREIAALAKVNIDDITKLTLIYQQIQNSSSLFPKMFN